MKKTLFVMVLAVALVMAFAGTAMAKITNAYVTWDPAAQPAGYDSTPHQGYAEGTEKCAVCHAVHNAPVTGTQWTGAGAWGPVTDDSEMLLRSSVSNACVYCHITTAIGGKQLYNGQSVLWTAPGTVSAYAENVAHNRNSANCVNCHAVHGAGTFGGAVAAKLLKFPADTTKFQDEIFAAGTGLYADAATARNDANRDGQVSVFCTQCHQNFSAASETTLNVDGDALYGDAAYSSTTGLWSGVTSTYQYKSHPLKAAGGEGNNFVAKGATVASTTVVAFAGSQYCRSCHDAGGVDSPAGVIDNSFPHYTAGAFNFMKAGANASGATGLHDKAVDGHCLKCHVSADGSSGVGTTF